MNLPPASPSPDILIIGAGVNGLLSALKLAEQGLRVCVLDQGGLARESTWAGAGILSPLLPWDYGEDINALTERGRALWPGLAEALHERSGVDPEYWPCGMLAAGDFPAADAQRWCDAHGWTCADASAAPGGGRIDCPAGATRVWLPDVAQARNPRLARALITACARAGVELLEHHAVSGFRLAGERIQAVLLRDGERAAGQFVLAGGAWSRILLAAGLPASATESLPAIHPVRGQIVLFKAEPGLLPHIVLSQGKYLVPRRDGHILAGSTLEDVGFDKSCTASARESLTAFALGALPALADAELVHHWAGLRPGSPGNLPTIARHPRYANLFINSGHFRYGVTMAPASAELLLARLLGHAAALDATPYGWPDG